MDLRLQGKKAVVTGASRGIGRAIAETFANEGADVAICARKSEQVKEAVEVLKKKGVNAIGSALDISNGPGLIAWIREAGGLLGGIDILVSNPSGFGTGNREADWASGFAIDILGAVRSVEAAKPFLEKAALEKNDAAIVIIASVSAAEAHYESAYGAVKAALIHFAKAVARQQAPKRIRANVVSPGSVYFEGGVWHRMQQRRPDQFEQFMRHNPMGRMARPQEIADAVAFLASPVSSFTTGINMIVDGALTSRVNF